MTYDFKENRQIRIFISSTFRDMMQERDYLITRIFPELRRYCEDRDISLFELDLRWGVTQEESENMMAFKICLNEVDNTHPFFIGLLGERYGWVPDEKTIEQMKPTNVFEEYEWLMEELKNKKSITEVEMQDGAFLPGEDEEINAYFYIRSPKMKTPDEHREEKGSHGEKMLLELKDKIKNDKRYDFNEYESIEQLGRQVEEDFKKLVDKLFPEKGHLSDFEKEQMQQHVFLKSKTRTYVANPEWIKFLDDFADSDKRKAAITGASGMGQCALLANWIAGRQEKQIQNEKIIYHFTGISQSEGDCKKITKRLIDEVRFLYNLSSKAGKNKEEEDEEDFEYELQEVLFEIPEDQKLIIVLDSLDLIDDIENAKMLNWLPSHPDNVKFIYSSTTGDKTVEALERITKTSLELKSLPEAVMRELVVKYFEKFSKKLSSAQMEKIISNKKCENPAILIAILDNLRVFGNFDTLDKQIEVLLSCKTNESLFDLFLQNIESLFKEGVRKNIVKDILSLIALSRRGLTETEIVNISKVPKLYWSQLSSCMSVHLKTINGFVTFSGSIMLKAVKNRYLKKAKIEKQYREAISTYMEKYQEAPFNRKCEELPFQLTELKAYDRLYDFLLNKNAFDRIYTLNKYELGSYWRALRKRNIKRYKMEKYLEYSIEDKEELANYLEEVCRFINSVIIDPHLALVFAQELVEICDKHFGKDNEKTADAYIRIGQCYIGKQMRDYKKALNYFIEAKEIYEKVNGKNDYTVLSATSNIAVCYLSPSMGKYDEATKYLIEAREIIEKEFGDEEDTLIAAIYGLLGQCYMNNGNFPDAVECCCKSLELYEKFNGKDDPVTGKIYYSMGELLLNLEHYTEAVRFLKTFIEIWKEYFGERHPKINDAKNLIRICNLSMGLGLNKYEKAEEGGELTDKCKITYKNGDIYEGFLINNKRFGKGKYTYSTGDIYEGNWINDKCNGRGKFTCTIGVYEGEYKDGMFNGKGIYKFNNGEIYEGEYSFNKRTGKGKYTYSSGDIYEGDWVDGTRHGKGKYIRKDGTVYEGDFVYFKDKDKSMQHGKGKITFANGKSYEGDWANSVPNGKGKMIYPDGKVEEGDWKDGKFVEE